MDMPTETVIDLDDEPGAGDAATPTKAAEVDLDDDRILPRGCEKNDDGSVTVHLDHPKSITIRSNGSERVERHDRLTFHRLTGADLNAMRSTSADAQALVLFSRSTRIPHRVMSVLYAKLDGADIGRCDKVLTTFL